MIREVKQAYQTIHSSIVAGFPQNVAVIHKVFPALKQCLALSADTATAATGNTAKFMQLSNELATNYEIPTKIAQEIIASNTGEPETIALSYTRTCIEIMASLLEYNSTIFNMDLNNLFPELSIPSIIHRVNASKHYALDWAILLITFTKTCDKLAYINDSKLISDSLVQREHNDKLAPYLLVAYFHLLDFNHIQHMSRDTFTLIDGLFNSPNTWTSRYLFNVLRLHSLLYLKFAYLQDNSLIQNEGYFDSTIQTTLEDPNAVLHFLNEKLTTEWNSDLDSDVKYELYSRLQVFAASFVKVMGRVVKNLKNKEEDEYKTSAYANSTHGTNMEITHTQQPSRSFERLMILISILHKDDPESGLNYWGNSPELYKFVKWAADVRTSVLKSAYFDVLASLAVGRQSASQAHAHFCGNIRVSWTTLLQCLDGHSQTLTQTPSADIEPDEVMILEKLLKILKVVVSFSLSARLDLYNANFSAPAYLFKLLVCRIPSKLKGSIFEAISAFCVPLGDSYWEENNIPEPMIYHAEIVTNIWNMLETSQVLTYQSNTALARDGIIYDLEELESVSQTYPETLAFLSLLSALFESASHPFVAPVLSNLGRETRSPPGTLPYVIFVLEHVLLKVNQRAFAIPVERFKMISLCLQVLNKSILAFERASEIFYYGNNEHELVNISELPGFKLVSDILSGGKFISLLFEFIRTTSRETVDTKSYDIHHTQAVQLTLALFYRILLLQGKFLDVLMPALIDIAPTSSLTGLDQLLAYHKEIVVQIALYLNCTTCDQIVLLSTRIIKVLSSRSVFLHENRMVKLFERHRESEVVQAGFISRIQNGELNAVEILDVDLINEVFQSDKVGVAHAVRTSIMEMLLENISVSNGDSFAHFLLGYWKGGAELSSGGCFSEVLELLREGYDDIASRSGGMDTIMQRQESATKPMHQVYPYFAEQCYRLIYELCADTNTNSVTMRQLRSFEFVQTQIAALETVKIEGETDKIATEMYRRGWILKIAALELHCTLKHGQRSYAKNLIDLLFSKNAQYKRSTVYEQPLTKLLEILHCLQLDGFEDLLSKGESDVQPYYLTNFDPSPFTYTSPRGTVLFDIRSLSHFVNTYTSKLERENKLASTAQRAHLHSEYRNLALELLNENTRRQLYAAQESCIEAWSQILSVSLLKALSFIPANSRSDMLFEVLSSLLSIAGSPSTREKIGESISTLCVICIGKIVADGPYQSILESVPTVDLGSLEMKSMGMVHGSSTFASEVPELPSGTIQVDIIKGLLECILKPGTSLQQRGNFYGALGAYLQYIMQDKKQVKNIGGLAFEYGERICDILCRDASEGRDVWKTVAFKLLSTLFQVFEILPQQQKRGYYALPLDGLMLMSSSETKRDSGVNIVLNFVAEKNYLAHFVGMVERCGPAISRVLEKQHEDSDDMNQVYIYEALMSFFLRICQKKDGVLRLLDANLVDVLRDCSFFDQRPEHDISPADVDVFLPHVTELYHQVLMPSLELLSAILGQVGTKNPLILKKVAGFVSRHTEAILSILKDKTSVITLSTLSELKYVTFILSRLTNAEVRSAVNTRHGSWVSCNQALLALLNKYINQKHWVSKLKTMTETDVRKGELYATFAGNFSTVSLFKKEALALSNGICRNLLQYCQDVAAAPPFKPLFRWNLSSSREESVVGAVPPSLGNIISYLRVTTTSLFQNLEERESILAKIPEVHKLPIEDVEEICKRSALVEAFVTEEDLTSEQKHRCATRQLVRDLKEKTREILVALYNIENGLVLVWRHMNFYLETAGDNRGAVVAGTLQLDRAEVEKLVLDAAKSMGNLLLDKLCTVELPPEVIEDSEIRITFLNILMRKIKDLLALE